jgi:hypothetical protein
MLLSHNTQINSCCVLCVSVVSPRLTFVADRGIPSFNPVAPPISRPRTTVVCAAGRGLLSPLIFTPDLAPAHWSVAQLRVVDCHPESCARSLLADRRSASAAGRRLYSLPISRLFTGSSLSFCCRSRTVLTPDIAPVHWQFAQFLLQVADHSPFSTVHSSPISLFTPNLAPAHWLVALLLRVVDCSPPNFVDSRHP